MNYKNIKHLTKVEKPNIECFKCGYRGTLYELHEDEELYICENCWEKNLKTDILDRYSYDKKLNQE